MNQDTDNSATEHDVDIAELEDRLYAQVHYEIGNNEAAPPSSNDANDSNGRKQRDSKIDDKLRSVSAHCMVKNSSVTTSEKNGGRYWSGGASSRPSSPKLHYNKKESGVYNTLTTSIGAKNGAKNASAGGNNSSAAAPTTNKQNSNPIVPSSNKPKVFTPYKPLLSDAGVFSSTLNNEPAIDAIESHEPSDSESTGLRETSKLIRNQQKNGMSSSQTKRKNPFAAPPAVSKKETKRLNPFHKMRQENLKVKDKLEAKKKKNREKAAPVQQVIVDEDFEDDDVIILPTEPPPLICIDSSDDEGPKSKRKRAEPGTSKQQGRIPGNSRCTSPTNSILSADDFIVPNDRNRIERVDNDQFGGVSGDDLIDVNRTVERILRRTDGIAGIVAADIGEANDDMAIFATPLRKKKEKKSKEPAKSYEMSENSFAAVDVYESESSDMPDTIYAKGLAGKRKKASSSSSSEASDEVMDVPKSKRLKKRKSSGSAKGSDFPSTDESSSENELNDDAIADSIPYLIRGEAVGKVKKTSSRKAKKNLKRKRQQSDKLSDEEFISKLTSIVHGESEASNGEEIDENHETSNESIAARDIVKSVLQKRSKRAKKAVAEVNEGAQDDVNKQPQNEVETDGAHEQPEIDEVEQSNDHEPHADDDAREQQGSWIVKDQVGEIDEDEANRNLANISTSSIEIATFENEESDDINEGFEEKAPIENVQPATVTTANVRSDLFVFGEQNASAENLEMAWNEEMKCFYNKSWGGEIFKLGRIHARMPKSPLDWTVSNKDKFPSRGPSYRNRSNSRCINCHERGHFARDCTQPAKKTVCYMCGQEGHLEPRCPNKLCLKCGQPSRAYKFGCNKCDQDAQMQCFVCRMRGHKAVECPDKWRRYHSTIEPAVPLTEAEKLNPEKPKFCCVCAKRGHLAENCRNASRHMDRPISSLNIRSYRDAYNAEPIQQKDSQERFTICSTKVGDFDFNFGKGVFMRGNTIYGRFAQAVNLKWKKLTAKSRKPKATATSTVTSADANTTESTSSNKTEPKHRFFDEEEETPLTHVDVEDAASDKTVSEILVTTDTSARTNFPINDSSPIIAEAQEPANAAPINLSNDSDVIEVEPENDSKVDLVTEASEISETSMNVDETMEENETSSLSIDTERKLNQLKEYNSNMEQLLELKQQLLEQTRIKSIVKEMEKTKSTLSAADSTANGDSDSNYSFSEYYIANQEQRRNEPSTSASVALPDFIPLSGGSEANERFKETASPPESNDSSIAPNARDEAKVFLSGDHCKYLLTSTGHNFLKDKEVKHDVTIKLEWSNFGNVLCITGTRRSQDNFRTDLVGFLANIDKKIRSRSEVQIPKNRVQLIKHVSTIIRELHGLSMNNNVFELFHSMQRYEKPNTKASNRKAEKCRRFLNMALFGVYGFRDGAKHLQALQQNLRELRCSRDTNISVQFRQTINEHLNYIFSSHPHENYADLIDLYGQMKRSRTLPEPNLDRKLLGLSIDVQSNQKASNSTSDANNFTTERIDEMPSLETLSNIPALMDLQLNVSSLQPSSSTNGTEQSIDDLLPRKIDGSEIPSVEANQYAFWSTNALNVIEKLKTVSSHMSSEKLLSYERQAKNHELHYTEYSRLFKTLQHAVETMKQRS